MGQIVSPSLPSIILSATDRLVATNADGGLAVGASHVILFGQAAGQNLGALTNVIAQGFNAFSGGITDVALNGTIVLGGNAYKGAVNTATSGAQEASVIIGNNAMPVTGGGGAGANVVIGANALQNGVGGGGSNYSSNVVIGAQAGQLIAFANGAPFALNVILGFQAAKGSGAATSAISTVIIGAGACASYSNTIDNSVVIGNGAGSQLSGNANTIIGTNAVNTGASSGNNNVAIGSGANFTTGSFNTVVGAASGPSTGGNNTLIGARIGALSSASDCVVIGNQAGVFTVLANIAQQLLIDNGTPLIYGRFDRGNLMLGGASAADRVTLAGVNPSNAVFISNGTRGAGAPGNGGFFYVVAGALHWVGSAGTDTVVAPA